MQNCSQIGFLFLGQRAQEGPSTRRDLAKAEEHFAALERLPHPCEEYDDLKRATQNTTKSLGVSRHPIIAAVCRGATSGRVLKMLRTLGAPWPDRRH